MFDMNFEFASPIFLWGLLILPILAVWYTLIRKKHAADLSVPTHEGLESSNWLTRFKMGLSS